LDAARSDSTADGHITAHVDTNALYSARFYHERLVIGCAQEVVR
jgi:hypothetical protein